METESDKFGKDIAGNLHESRAHSRDSWAFHNLKAGRVWVDVSQVDDVNCEFMERETKDPILVPVLKIEMRTQLLQGSNMNFRFYFGFRTGIQFSYRPILEDSNR